MYERRSETITVKCSKKEKQIIKKKSEDNQLTMSAFLLESGIQIPDKTPKYKKKRRINLLTQTQQLINDIAEMMQREVVSNELMDKINLLKEGIEEQWEY